MNIQTRRFSLLLTAIILCCLTSVTVIATEPETAGDEAVRTTKDLIEKFDKDLEALIEDITGESRKLLTSGEQNSGLPEIVVWASAQSWAWTFKSHDLRDPNGAAHQLPSQAPQTDDGPPLNAIVFPKGAMAHINITSDDIIHPLHIPSLDINTEVVPGRLERVVVNTSATGVFPSTCGEVCNEQMEKMAFEIHVVDDATFAQWSKNLQKLPR